VMLSSQFPNNFLESFLQLTEEKDIHIVLHLSGGKTSEPKKSAAAKRFSIYASLGRLVQGNASRFTIIGSEPGILALFRSLGAQTIYLPYYLASIALNNDGKNIPSTKKIDLVIFESQSIENYIMHMVNAVFLLPKYGTEVGTIYLPSNHNFPKSILTQFNATKNIIYYDSPDDLENVTFSYHAVGLCVYPDEELPAAFEKAAHAGIPCLTGPTSAFDENHSLSSTFVITYWEDTSYIVRAILQFCENYHDIGKEYNNFAKTCRKKAQSTFKQIIVTREKTERKKKNPRLTSEKPLLKSKARR